MHVFLKEIYNIIFSLSNCIASILPDSHWGNRTRGLVIGGFCKGSKKNLQIAKGVQILYPYKLHLGDDVFLGHYSWINAFGTAYIESECMIGPFTCITTGNHSKQGSSYRFGPHIIKPIRIKFGSWLGAHACVMPGTTIGPTTVIAAGGIVTKDALEPKIYAGVPAKIINHT